jgi:ubiquinone/menaquinone biosynthesis C-methylase UbiE
MTILITIVIASCVIWFGWRIYSQHNLLPCPSWLAWLIELENPLAPAHKANAIIANLELKDGMNILDIGCGPGRVTIPIAKTLPNGHVFALDIQQTMLDKVRSKANNSGLKNISFLQGIIGKIKLNDNEFDRILLIAVLGEIPNAEKELVLKQVFHYLKPNGVLSISESIFDPHFQRLQYVTDLMLTAGFIEKKTFGRWFAYTIQFEKPITE